MKKHDEGYVLAFVMVVITVLCLIAVLLMPLSLRNLEAQNDSIRRMQDKYVAQGVIETVVAKMDSTDMVEKAVDLASSLQAYLGEDAEILVLETVGETDGDDAIINSFAAKVKIIGRSANGSVKAEAILIWEASVVDNTETGKYQITPNSLEYESYQVSSVREEGPDD